MLESHQVSRRFICQTAVLAILFFIAVAPTATMLQFCRTPENLVIAAALECKRDGHWLMPTLEGELRTAKPPLPTWITAASMTTSTVNQMSDPDPAKRFEAAQWLAWETRWPAIVIATITLIATAELSRLLLGSEWLGLASMMLLASGFLYLRFATEAATDSSLMLWVTVANVFLVRAIYLNQRWVGCIGAGTALGLAFMCKGPVAFIETIVPIVVLAAWKRPAVSVSLREWAAPVLIGVACGLLIALPWPIAVLMQNPAKQAEFWIKQISGQDAPKRHDPIWNYPLRLTTGVLPSFVLLYAGVIRGWRTRTTGALAAIIFLLVPVLILTCFKDRKDRYLLPMMPAAAIVSAIALSRANRLDWPKIWQWIVVTIVAVGLPIAGATRGLRGVDGQPWLTPAFGAAAASASAVILIVAWVTRKPVEVATFAVMLVVQFVFVVGYRRSEGGQSDMLPLATAIWAAAPDAQTINGLDTNVRPGVDLSIYLNRTTPWMPPDQWRKLSRGDRPRVVILLQEDKEPPPHVPAGWSSLASIPYGKERWWALLLPRA